MNIDLQIIGKQTNHESITNQFYLITLYRKPSNRGKK